MKTSKLFTCRRSRIRSRKPWAILVAITMVASTMGHPPAVVQAQAQVAPVSAGFNLDGGDLRFIYHAIEIAQDHAAGGSLVGPGPNQVSAFGVSNPQLPLGLRTVDGSFNNLVPGQSRFGSADQRFPRLLPPSFKPAEAGTSYTQKSGVVTDSQPRVISNLIVDQSTANPAAVAANANPCGSGGFVCGGGGTADPTTGSLFIPNITPDFGLSAPFNLMFTFFGQFFDHGLDLVNKGGSGTVIMPLKADDPLFVVGSTTNFMAMPRATNLPGPDGILGTADDIQEGINQTTPWVDQNQTYTSHPSHQVFLRQYALVAGRPVQTGRVADGGFCAPRPTGIPGDNICNIANWNEVKAQSATMLGIRLTDADIFDAPLILTDPYGHFKPGPLRGMAQLVLPPGNVFLEGNTAAGGLAIPANALRTGHAFLNDIAHSAVPTFSAPGVLFPDADAVAGTSLQTPSPAGSYDNELLGLHFITGDGRGNENIGLTTMHNIFHSEHNRLAADIDRLINLPATGLTAAEIAAWHSVHAPSGWNYEERLFQAARFCTEMQYQHLVFEEFARKVQPLVRPFTVYQTSINPAIVAEFAHTVYRLGHSMLPEVVSRMNADGTVNDIRLFDAFLNPASYNNGGTAGTLTAAQAAGSVVRGFSLQVANELDEFVTSSVRNTLVGLPLDLPAINIARGRSEGIPSLNSARRTFFTATRDASVQPYANWFEFGLNLKHQESLVNFVAAYGTDPTITAATTVAAKRLAAAPLVAANGAFMFQAAATSGLDNVDFWMGGLAERQAVFGGLLGSTFDFVFKSQLENLQDGDRFYYLQRTDGLNLRFQLEGNSFAELIRRNTDFSGGMDIVFNTADFNFNAADLTGTATIPLAGGSSILTLPDGTKVFLDPLHRGQNIVFNGGPGNDRFRSDVGDDTLYGNAGNDRLDGWEGNDTLQGGDGDDILFGGNGDDVLKGGNGNDALSSGPGFGGDINMAGEGNDFVVDGPDSTETFGGPGNDVILDGDAATEGMIGGPGDDWIEGGLGHDANMFGDNGNFFDILAGLNPVGGDDVLDGDGGQDNHFGEGGDDIMIMNEGTNMFFGDFGFDWITQRAWPFPADIELNLLVLPTVPLNFNDLRNKYRMTDGASGWALNDHIRGDDRVNDPAAPPELFNLPGTELRDKRGTPQVITGLAALMAAFGKPFPTPFNAGNILLGGGGRDLMEGKGGDDLIDGDMWLNVQLRAVLNDGTVKVVNSGRDLIDDVFADPQRLNPGNITIVREILQGAPGLDTAVFSGPIADYLITPNPNGTVTVFHTAGVGFGPRNDGTDTLRNIEKLQFTDTTITTPGVTLTVVPNVVNLTQTGASAALTGAGLVLGTITTANSATIAAGRVISANPPVGAEAEIGEPVNLVVSLGATPAFVPNVVGSFLGTAATPGPARQSIAAAGLVVGTVTSVVDAAPLDMVISTTPVAGTSVTAGSAVNVTRSLGAAVVPNVVGQAQATAQANIAAALLTSSIVTANSATVAAGNVISTSPVAGTIVATGSNVVLTVSLGPVLVLVPNVVGQAQATAQANIAAAGLTSSIVTANSATVAAGNVISTSPVAGTSVATGSNVVLTVSLGPVLVLVPNVVGQAQATAQANIAAAGLTSSIVTASSATVAAGNVISTSPVAGTSVATGSNVVLTVSLGPANVLVPNVVGQAQATAQANIAAAGLTSSIVTANSATVAAGLVISTSPVAGTNVASGSNVVLTVSLGAVVVGAGPTIAQSVSVDKQNTVGNAVIQTALTAITPAANTLIVAFVAADAPGAGANTTVTSVTNTGVALTWTLARRSNTQRGTSEVWWAFSTPAHAAMRVTATLSQTTNTASTLQVVTFTGAVNTLVGAAGVAANAATGSPTASLVTTSANSLVFAVGNDFDNPRTMIMPAGRTSVHQFTPAVGDTYWVQRTTTPVAAVGTTVPMSVSYAGANTDRWNLALIEIR